MIERLIQSSLRSPLLVILFAIALAAGGVQAYRQLPVDAFPDVTPVLVQIFTESPGLAPEEVELLVTYPIEVAMNGLPGIRAIRSLSTFGLSAVSVYFEDDIDLYFARQLVFERLQAAREDIPEGLGDPELGPITTGLGQVYLYIVEGKGRDLMELRTLEDWIVKFNLRAVPGLTEILSFGGLEKQFQVRLYPNQLLKYDITLGDVVRALKENNANAGGSFLERGSEETIVRGLGWAHTTEDLGRIVVEVHDGTPVRISDLAEVVTGPAIRRGAVTKDAKGEVVSGIALKLIGVNTSSLIDAIRTRVAAINEILPEGVRVVPYYDQSSLVAKAIGTVSDALLEGGILVVAILLLLLGNLRSAITVALMLPLSVLFAFLMMRVTGLTADLMSLGGLAIGIGMMVDGGVVMVENVYRHLSEREAGEEPTTGIVLRAAREVGRPITFAIVIIIIVFMPLFALEGVEGKLFKPLAFTISYAMLGSLILSLTVIPVLCAMWLRGGREEDVWLLRIIRGFYTRLLHWAVRRRRTVVAIAMAALLGSLSLVPLLGTEFVPVLNEGTFLIRVTLAPGASLNQAIATSGELERILLSFPETLQVVSKVGRAEVGGDPEPVNNVEIFVDLKPEGEWTTASSREGLIAAMETKLSEYPGILLNFSQPIALRVDELLSGVKAQLAISLFGDDLDKLYEKGEAIRKVITAIPGAADVQLEQASGQPQLQIRIDRDAIARYGINVADVQEVIRVGVGGEAVGQVFEGQRRFDVFVRLVKAHRSDPKAIGSLLVAAPGGERVPLARLATIEEIMGPKQISRERNQRRIVIQANVRGRDMGGFVSEAQQLITERVDLPPGYLVEFGGQFENQQRAMARLAVIVPTTIGLIFLLLYLAFNSLRKATLIILNVPFAMVGGIVALFVTGLYLSVPASVGFIALFGVAVLNGVVMVSCIGQLREEGSSVEDAVIQGAQLRLRPVLLTALVASLGLVPLLFATGTGSAVQRPLATVVVGGLITSTFLTLLVLPALYGWFEPRRTTSAGGDTP